MKMGPKITYCRPQPQRPLEVKSLDILRDVVPQPPSILSAPLSFSARKREGKVQVPRAEIAQRMRVGKARAFPWANHANESTLQ